MRNLILWTIINAVAIAMTALILPGIHVVNNDIGTYLIIGLVFGIVNGVLKPIITFLTCPFVILTLGLFMFVINGLMLWITAELLPDRLVIDSFGWAVLGGIIMAIVGAFLQAIVFGSENDSQSTTVIIRR